MPLKSQEVLRGAVRTDGQTMAEYAVVLGVITVTIVAAYAALSGAVQGLFERAVGVFS